LELEPAVPGPVILDDQCVPQCTVYALRNSYHSPTPPVPSAPSGMRRPCGGRS
jgi:hypothetical protein